MLKRPFIVFDGPNGVGKSTIIKSVTGQLEQEEIKCYLTKEPTKSELGIFIRNSQNSYSKEVLACMVAANRYEHLDTIIKSGIKVFLIPCRKRSRQHSQSVLLLSHIHPHKQHQLFA